MLSVLICDNQLLTSQGLSSILSVDNGIKVIGVAKNFTELEQQIHKFKPNVIIIDPYYDNNFGLQDIKNVQKKFAFAKILVISNQQPREEILEILNLGVKYYVSKQCSYEDIILAIYAAAKGEQFYCKNTIQILFEDKAALKDNDIYSSLSLRETEIIQLIAAGMSNKEIAEKLFLSIHTIKTHRKNIIKKLGFTFKNAAGLMLYTNKQGN